MQMLQTILKTSVSLAIEKAFKESLGEESPEADIAACTEEKFGHYQCNSALRLAKQLKLSPRAVAEKIVSHFDAAICEKVEIAGPGFINFHLSSTFLSGELNRQLKDPLLGAFQEGPKKRIVVEFSSPNVAKELHVGHLRSTIIGDAIARLFEFLGQDVVRLNHIGDWGTQFGMLITYLKEHYPKGLKEEEKTLPFLMHAYRASKTEFDRDPAFKKRAQLQVVALQQGEKEALHAWREICDISRKGFYEIYDLLGVKIQERGESFYNENLSTVVSELEEKGLVTISDGAKCVFLEGFTNREGNPLPVIVQKSDGGYNYDTTDLAALRHRIFEEKADRIIVVTDAGQSLHFQMVIAIAKKAGWFAKGAEFDHVIFGLVLGPDGKKFKTRSGETEKLIDLLTGAIDRAQAILEERRSDFSVEEKKRLAHVLGIGAIKYADLSSHRTKDYTFSYDRMLRFEGNTAVFLLYAYVRICGIKRKTKRSLEELVKETIQLQHVSEISLGLHLRRFGEILDLFAKELLPNRLTDYLYTLAEKFNAFFRDCRVEGTPEEGSRLLLLELTGRVLKQGLEILGLEVVETM